MCVWIIFNTLERILEFEFRILNINNRYENLYIRVYKNMSTRLAILGPAIQLDGSSFVKFYVGLTKSGQVHVSVKKVFITFFVKIQYLVRMRYLLCCNY